MSMLVSGTVKMMWEIFKHSNRFSVRSSYKTVLV